MKRVIRSGATVYGYELRRDGGTFSAQLDGAEHTVTDVGRDSDSVELTVDGVRRRFNYVRERDAILLTDGIGYWRFALGSAAEDDADGAEGGGRVLSHMPGKVLQVLAQAGDAVEKGQPLLILEAMKMEHTIAAPFAGVLREQPHEVGARVMPGALLAVVEPA